MHDLLTSTQMAAADKAAIAGGTPGITLMENAGRAVFDAVRRAFSDATRVLVVCGSGNNGGDGFVVARLLAEAGVAVQVDIIGDPRRLSGDAALAFGAMDAGLLCAESPSCADFDVIVDALFGAGLNRPIAAGGAVSAVVGKWFRTHGSRDAASVVAAINASGLPVVSVDLPSGVDGATGQVLGTAITAHTTVTFFRYKPAHLLFPGRALCGERVLADIGIPDGVLSESGRVGRHNTPALWRGDYPMPSATGHKYNCGHCVVVSGPLRFAGAARLAAGAALRVGAGLVTLACPSDTTQAHASQLTSVMLAETDGLDALVSLLADPRLNSVALGFGLPPDAATRELARAVLALGRRTVLDAGALVAFAETPAALFDANKQGKADVVLTPHDGEFARLFPDEAKIASRIERAKAAALKSGATVLLKGPDTVVASPNGDTSVADNAPPWLATAGSGDVLAGVVAGLLAQGMPPFSAASAAVWLHGEAARQVGPALVSSDLDTGLKEAIQREIFSFGEATHV